jgi:hypothetical protein
MPISRIVVLPKAQLALYKLVYAKLEDESLLTRLQQHLESLAHDRLRLSPGVLSREEFYYSDFEDSRLVFRVEGDMFILTAVYAL